MVRKYNMYTVLRLMTLLSTTNSGLKDKEFDQLRRAFVMCYGYQEIATVLNLQDARLLKPRDKRFDWNKIKSEFELVIDEESPAPQDHFGVFSFLDPISVRLLERIFKDNRGFAGNSKVLNLLAGHQISPKPNEEMEFLDQSAARRTKKVLVYFLGGVTFAEISGIRKLNTICSGHYKFVIATTSIISSEKCMM